MGLLYLYIYTIILLVILIKSIIDKKNSMYCFMWGLYALSGVFCIINKTFQDEIIGNGYSHNQWFDLSDSSLLAFFLIILCCYISFRPLQYYNADRFVNGFEYDQVNKMLLLILSVCYFVFFVTYLATSFSIVVQSFSITDYGSMRDTLYGNANHESTVVISASPIGNICFKICWALRYLIVYVCFILIRNRRKLIGIIVLICNFFLVYIYSNLNAARGGLLIFLFCAFLFAFPILQKLSKRIKRILLIGAIVIAIVAINFVLGVTVSRTANNQSGNNLVLQNICFYLGHAPIIFSKLFGSLNDFAYGQFTIGRLLNHFFGFSYDIAAIKQQLGYPSVLNYLFSTYLFPIYADFGSIGCVLFFSLSSFLMKKVIKEPKIRLSTVFLFSYYVNFFITGNFVISSLEFASTITTVFIFLVFRLLENIIIQKSRINKRL